MSSPTPPVFEINDPVRKVIVAMGDLHNPKGYVEWEWQDTQTATWHSTVEAVNVTWANSQYTQAFQRLQAKYTGPHGLRNGHHEHGAEPTYEMWALGVELTHDQWRARGHWNPLDQNGAIKYNNKLEIEGRFAQKGRVLDDFIRLETGVEVHPEHVSGGIVQLRQWTVNAGRTVSETDRNHVYFSTDEHPLPKKYFRFTLEIPEFDQVTPGQKHLYDPIAGLIQWLNSIRENPDTSPAVTGQGSAAFGHPQNHRFIIPESRTIDNDYYQLMIYLVANYIRDGFLIRLEILGVGIGANYAPHHLQNAIGVQSETLDTRVYEHRSFGVRNTPARMLKAVLSDTVEIDAVNGIPRLHVKDVHDPTFQVIPFGNHRVIDFEDLDPVVDESMTELYRLMPEPLEKPMVHEIHHYGAGNKAIRLLDPERANEYSGTSRPIVIDNQGTGRLTVQDWDGNNIVTLAPNQDAKLRFVYDNFGGSRLLGEVTERYIEASDGDLGTFVNTGYYDFDTNNWAKPVPVATPSYIDTDAFEIGTDDNVTNATQWNVANVETALSPDTLKILKNGTLEFHQSVVFTIVGTGSMTAGSVARVYLLRDDTLTVIDESDYDEIVGDGTSRSLRWGFRRRVKKGDVIIPMYVYPKGTSLNINSCKITDFLRTVTLDQEIAIEYTSPNLPTPTE